MTKVKSIALFGVRIKTLKVRIYFLKKLFTWILKQAKNLLDKMILINNAVCLDKFIFVMYLHCSIHEPT